MGVAIRELLVDCKHEVTWQDLPGIAAVDANNALYQFLTIIRQPDGTPLMNKDGDVTSHLSGILFRITSFLENGLKPVFVFDGKPPDLKAETVAERREARERAGAAWKEAVRVGDLETAYRKAVSSTRIDNYVIETSHRLLDLMGIPHIQAPSEGEAQAAHMAGQGVVEYVVSQDYDSLLFGAPVLVRNLTVSGKRKFRNRTVTIKPERIILDDFLNSTGISRDDLIKISVLIGTDFNEGIKGVGPKTALKIVTAGMFEETMEEKLPGYDPSPVLDFFSNPPVVDCGVPEWRPPDVDGIVVMLCDEFGFSEERVRNALGRLSESNSQKTLDQWF